MSFVVGCSCGKKFRVDDQKAGKHAKCPGCGATLDLIPVAGDIDWQALANLELAAAPDRARPAARAKGAAPQPDTNARRHPCPKCGRTISVFAMGCEYCGAHLKHGASNAKPTLQSAGALASGIWRQRALRAIWKAAMVLSILAAVAALVRIGFSAGSVAGLFTFLFFVLAMGAISLLGAVLLRAAVALYNLIVGGVVSPNSVPAPPFSQAVEIAFVTTLVNTVAGYFLALATGALVLAAGARISQPALIAQLICTPFSLVISAVGLSEMLPTTFPRALLVGLCFMLMVVILAVLVGVIFAAVASSALATG